MSFDVELATRSGSAPALAEVTAVLATIGRVLVRSVGSDGSCVATIGDSPAGAPATIEFSDEFLDDPDDFDGATLIGWVISVSYAADDAQVAMVTQALEELTEKLGVVAVDLQDESEIAPTDLTTRFRAEQREVSGFLDEL